MGCLNCKYSTYDDVCDSYYCEKTKNSEGKYTVIGSPDLVCLMYSDISTTNGEVLKEITINKKDEFVPNWKSGSWIFLPGYGYGFAEIVFPTASSDQFIYIVSLVDADREMFQTIEFLARDICDKIRSIEKPTWVPNKSPDWRYISLPPAKLERSNEIVLEERDRIKQLEARVEELEDKLNKIKDII